ncbi:hypothetical protein GDO86_006642 [Hymenochirus boettgeri]|uniref:Interleukin-1 n=1 Tax=Hymenochirus boettgeri TaxID=247094 RepID=A0A8T2JEH1_9PIPI|nr:hypothetical protein GDO86_006642 [Hymenochirus boettgeri]
MHWHSCSSKCEACTLGFGLQITQPKEPLKAFKKAVVLVVAVEKLKQGTGKCFLDMDLLSLLDNIFVEEDIPISQCTETTTIASLFRYQGSTMYRIKDTASKCFVMQQLQGNAHLVALQLQGQNIQREEKISMAFYAQQPFNGGPKRPVALGLAGRNMYMSCRPTEEDPQKPKLHLEEIGNIKGINNQDLPRFIFMKSQNGLKESSPHSFESAAFPGWYISTSQKENELVQMIFESNQKNIKEFNLFQSS